MAFTAKIGNIYLDSSYFLIGNPGSSDIFISDVFGFNWNTVPWGDDNTEKYQHLKSRGNMYVPSNNGTAFAIPLKSTSGAARRTVFESYYNNFTQTADGNYGDVFSKPNVPLNIQGADLNIRICEWLAFGGSNCYILGVPVYSDDSKTRLTAVVLPYAYLTSGSPIEEHGGRGTFGSVNINAFRSRGFDVVITKTDDDYGDESVEDGYGTDGTPDFDHSSDVIGVPSDPTVSTGTVGFMNVYCVGQGALSGLGEYLFPELDPTQWTDVTQVLRGIAGIFAYRDSIQYVVDLHAIPVTPTTGTSKYIKLGALETDISQPVCSSDYVNFDCGTVSIPERFRNFLDYTEVTCKIYIPFFGFVDLKPEYWASGSIGLKYKFNVIDGSFMAFLVSTSSKSRLANTVIGQYSGSACLHLPVVAASYGSIVSGLISGSAAMATAGTKETSPGSVSGAMEGAMTAGNFQPKMSQSNDYNCSAAYLGCREAYLLIEYPVQSFSANYPHDSGLPANITRTIQSMLGSGYTVIESIDLTGLGITESEISELKDIFAGGFYL